ncbi:MAG: Transcriptional regulatory protein DegU [Chroococcidiopsis sp. SAG 2025]|uniref:response regulator transcription factor n=1 Tax=Chroococcidiopsis sp. SAG 2025 TaxID=171389 RepID=UPI00293704BB|nr:response regulator transcription factor [Chroococcidiopsis sp. SAG 2025]MDV2996922.1 Transcriptional regulatory protein DegU [Chroococcidiopsis sp. SAG 2025]
MSSAPDNLSNPNYPSRISLLIAEDHAVVREGFAAILNDEPDLHVVAEATNGQIAVQLYEQHQPDVVLMDLRMPQLDGVNAIAQIRSRYPTARIIILTTYDGDEDIYRGLQAGASGYLLKDATADNLIQAIHQVHQGDNYIPPAIAKKLAERIKFIELTERELEVLQLLVVGQSNAEIGASLSIAERTVKFHTNNIFTKLGVSDRTQAVLLALKRGLARLETRS